jgi:hypothetical protein
MKNEYVELLRFCSIVAGVSAVLSASRLPADVVVMKSGKAHEGTVVSFDGKELTLEINDGKSILSRTEVDSVFFGIDAEAYKSIQKAIQKGKEPAKKPEGLIPFGETGKGKLVAITIVSARIGKIPLRGNFGRGNGDSASVHLEVIYELANIDERKVVRFSEGFFSKGFTLVDDAGNGLRGIDFGVSYTPEDLLTKNDDILPESSVKKRLVFQELPPRTKSVELRVSLSCFGDRGTLKFEIPVTDIEGFSPETKE